MGDSSFILEQARSVVTEKGYVHKGDIAVFTLGDRTTSPSTDDVGVDPTVPSPRPTNVMQIVQIGIEEGGN